MKVGLLSSSDRVFTSARKVLQGACHMVAMQLATEPLVRQAVRQVFQTRALLTVKPTKKGKKVRSCAFYTHRKLYVTVMLVDTYMMCSVVNWYSLKDVICHPFLTVLPPSQEKSHMQPCTVCVIIRYHLLYVFVPCFTVECICM